TVFVHRHAAEFAVVLGEMDRGHDDIVLRHALGRQPSAQIVHFAENSGDSGGPFLAADADGLRQADALAGPELLEQSGEGQVDLPCRGANRLGRRTHSTSPRPGAPRTRAIRPVRASSTIPYGRISSINASIFRSLPEISSMRLSGPISTTRARNISTK